MGEKQVIKWTAEGTVKCYEGRVFCDVRTYVSCQGYIGISQSAQYHAANQGGTADKNYSSLTELISFVKDFLFCLKKYGGAYYEFLSNH